MRIALGCLVLLGLEGCLAKPASLVQAPPEGLDLTLLHVNDMHARYEQTNHYSGTCSDKDAKAGNCFGGHARVRTVIKETREKDKNVLVLNAGDTYQGTVYYSIFKWNISAHFVNLMGFDAITLGNHEFDDHAQGLAPFIQELKIPLVIANVDFSKQPEYNGLSIKPSHVFEIDGHKIGVIGYLTPDTAFLSSVDNVSFRDEVEALKEEAARLKKDGVNIIIGLGHSGYERDQVIAREVPDMDLVVGGHSHSFLYDGGKKLPDTEVPVGLYPTFVEQPSGRRVPVVQAYAFTKYMGRLHLKFDGSGELTSIEGSPILLDKSIAEDPTVLEDVLKWKAEMNDKVMTPIGRTPVLLDGATCRAQECNLGNLIADAFVYSRAETKRNNQNDGWSDAPIALVNGGSIRTSIDASSVGGTITIKDVMEVMPFDNLEVMLKLKGSVIRKALEHGVSEYVPGQAWKGGFLQLSGVKVIYDVYQTPQHRVVSVQVRCGSCKVPTYEPLDDNAVYGVVMSTFLANGGDGFDMFADNEGSEMMQDTDAAVVQRYIQERQLVYPGLEDRIVFQSSSSTASPVTSSTARPVTSSAAPPATSSTPAPTPSGAVRQAQGALSALLVALVVLCR